MKTLIRWRMHAGANVSLGAIHAVWLNFAVGLITWTMQGRWPDRGRLWVPVGHPNEDSGHLLAFSNA